MRALLFVVPLLALEGLAAADENETVQDFADALAGHHLDRAERLLAPKVELGPLRFAADDCKHFERAQPLAGKDREAFVDCLARLAPSGLTKHHSSKTTGALLVRDGLALGAQVANRQIAALRFVDTDAQDAGIPTVFRAADVIAEHAQISDELRQTIDARDDHRASATLKACLDAKGKVARTRVVEASGVADFDALARAAVDHHAFAPVQLAGAAAAVCEVVRFELDTRPGEAGIAKRPITVALAALEPSRTKGTPAGKLAPDPAARAAIARQKLDGVHGTWKACFDGKGAFVATQKLKSTGVPAFDAQVDKALAKWGFQSVPDANGVCTLVTIDWHR